MTFGFDVVHYFINISDNWPRAGSLFDIQITDMQLAKLKLCVIGCDSKRA